MKLLPKRLCYCVSLLLAGSASLAAMTLNRGDAIQIIVPENASPTESFAAGELSRYLGELADLQCRTTTEGKEPAATKRILVGRTTQGTQAAADLPRGVASDGPDSYVISISDNEVVLAGGADRGTVYAAYDLLERLGCRFLLPGDEVIPRSQQIALINGTQVRKPAFISREIDGSALPGGSAEQMIDWCVKNAFNKRFNLRTDRADYRQMWRMRGGERRWQWTAHNLQFIFTPELFQQHPEYFSLYNGRRVAMGVPGRGGYGGGSICTTNPEVIRIVADYAGRWFDEHADGSVFPIWPGDGDVRWCECDNCAALGGKNFTSGPEGSMSRRLETFVREVAKLVAEKHPDRQLLLPAYSNYTEPADESVLPENIIVQLCNYSVYSRSPDDPENSAAARRLEAWARKAPGRLGIWEYGLIGDPHATTDQQILLPLVKRYAGTMRYLQRIGGRFYYSQGNSVYHRSNPLLMWAIGKLAWDPQQDVDLLIRDYCEAAYGPAADPCSRIYILLENQVQTSRWLPTTYGEMAVPSALVFTPEISSQCVSLLDQAQHAAGLNDEQKQRLTQLKAALDSSIRFASVQTLAGLDGSVPWRLARGKEAYVVNADGPDLDARLFDLQVLSARDQGHFDAAFERTVFRARKRKEPVVTISNSGLSVSVIPGLGGRIIRLVDQTSGHNFFQEYPNGESDQLKKMGESYFAYGGYEEYVGAIFAGSGWETSFQCEASADGKSLTMFAEIPVSTGKLALERNVEIVGGDTPELKIVSRLRNVDSPALITTLRSHPLVSVGGTLAETRLYLRGGTDVTATPREQHDGPSVQPQGVWGLYNPRSQRALVHRFSANAASAYFFADEEGRYANLELKHNPESLKQGEELVLEQSFIPAVGMAQVTRLLQSVFTEAVVVDAQSATTQATTRPVKVTGKLPGARDGALVFDGKSFVECADDLLRISPAGGSIEMELKLNGPVEGPQFLVSSGSPAAGWFYVVLEQSPSSPVGAKVSVLFSRGTKPFTAAGQFYARVSADLPAEPQSGWRNITVNWHGGDGDGSMTVLQDGQVLEKRSNMKFDGAPLESSLIVGRSSGQNAGYANLAMKSVVLKDAAGNPCGGLTADANGPQMTLAGQVGQ